MCVADDHVEFAPFDGLLQQPQRVARHADESRFPFLLQVLKHAIRFVEDVLVVVRELDVMCEEYLDVIRAEPLQ